MHLPPRPVENAVTYLVIRTTACNCAIYGYVDTVLIFLAEERPVPKPYTAYHATSITILKVFVIRKMCFLFIQRCGASQILKSEAERTVG